jgi:hypothetical protein
MTRGPGSLTGESLNRSTSVDERKVFAYLQKQKKAVLLDYLQAAFVEMTDNQRRAVFADTVPPPKKAPVDGERLRQEIDQFRRDSLARKYYAPFNMNSKNWRDIPEKTRQWCDLFAGFVADASTLTARGDHEQAVACFAVLYELLDAMESGDEIIFAEEVGCWLIHTDEKAWLRAYLTSLATTATPEAFTAAVIPMLERDCLHSFASGVHALAQDVANQLQMAHLEAELQRRQIRTRPNY